MLFFDIELFPDLFIVGFMNEQCVYRAYTLKDLPKILALVASRELVGYNSTNYDLPILEAAINGASLKTLNSLSNQIIQGEKVWCKERYRHIDLMQVAPALKISLKLYAGRMHFPTMKELKFDRTPPLSVIKDYNKNDLLVTQALYNRVKEKIELRKAMPYQTDMRSKSDAQIAEAVMRELIPSYWMPYKENYPKFQYQRPDWLQPFGAVDASTFSVGETGSVLLPPELKAPIIIDNKKYQMGIGGLHSKESNVYHEDVWDYDVTSFYPNIILKLKLHPQGLGPSFLKHYQKIVKDRVKAKQLKDTVKNETYKILINGAFGKLGSKYSCLYAPELLIQVTVTGQLVILNLIAHLTNYGVNVISANTDGIVVDQECHDLVDDFLGFEFEATHYQKYFGRDVNNYVAIKDDLSVKTKGTYSPASLTKNPDNEIIGEAVIQYLLNQDPIDHILSSNDITKFLQVRTVRGGAVFEGSYLGKVVRYYHSKSSQSCIHYETNGNKVPKSQGCRPLMNLEDIDFNDIDRDWYIQMYRKEIQCVSQR